MKINSLVVLSLSALLLTSCGSSNTPNSDSAATKSTEISLPKLVVDPTKPAELFNGSHDGTSKESEQKPLTVRDSNATSTTYVINKGSAFKGARMTVSGPAIDQGILGNFAGLFGGSLKCNGELSTGDNGTGWTRSFKKSETSNTMSAEFADMQFPENANIEVTVNLIPGTPGSGQYTVELAPLDGKGTACRMVHNITVIP